MKRIPVIRSINAIYAIKNTVNNKIYIGSTYELRKRWNDHIRELNAGVHINDHLQKSWNKYGMESFEFLVLLEVPSVDALLNYEDEYIEKYHSMNPDFGYNLISADRHNISDSTREKLSMTSTGRYHSDESKKKISDANRGRMFTEEHRRKLSESHKGKHLSEQAKRKVSEFQKSREWTAERQAQFEFASQKAHDSLRGKKLSELEVKKKIEGRKHQCVCIDCGITFETTGVNTKRCINCRKEKDKQDRANYKRRN